MGCIYCGKEIGPLRIIRDKEFCSTSHRRAYHALLHKAFNSLAEPEPPPAPIGKFIVRLNHVEPASASTGPACEFEHSSWPVRLPGTFPAPLAAVLGSAFSPISRRLCTPASSAVPLWDQIAEQRRAAPEISRLLVAPRPQSSAAMPGAPFRQMRPVSPNAAQVTAWPADLLPTPAASSALGSAPALELSNGGLPVGGSMLVALPAPHPPSGSPAMEGPVLQTAQTGPRLPEPALSPVHEAWWQSETEFGVAADLPLAAGKAIQSTSADSPPSPFTHPPIAVELQLKLAPLGDLICQEGNWSPAHCAAAPGGPEAVEIPVQLASPLYSPIAGPAAISLPGLTAGTLRAGAPRSDETADVGPRLVAAVSLPPQVVSHSEAAVRPPVLPGLPSTLEVANLLEGEPAEDSEMPTAVADAVAPPALVPAEPPRGEATCHVAPTAPAFELVIPHVPPPTAAEVSSQCPAGFVEAPVAAAQPEGVETAAKQPPPEPALAASLCVPEPQAGELPLAVMPRPEFVELEYFVQRVRGAITENPGPVAFAPEAMLPRLELRAALELRFEDLAPPERRNRPAFAEIFSSPEAAALRGRSPAVTQGMRAIAASVMVGVALWFGAATVRFGKQAPAAQHTDADTVSTDGGTLTAVAPSPGGTRGASGPLQRVRAVIANRAAAELNDTFRSGMAAWGSAPKGWAPGWSRHPDGYVRPGSLALLRPSLTFTDYRMEFLTLIERKSVGWVMRARDADNYYAMKFTVVDPGLRPVIAVVHYPVLGGKKGKRTEVPLNVMVHNDRPYQVTVDVKGNRFTTSIEGQEVDTWVDETLTAGGVGFFSEAGEQSRLYWLRVVKNDDFLGRVCAFLSGSEKEARLIAPAGPDLPGGAQPETLAALAALPLAWRRPAQRTRRRRARRRLPRDYRFAGIAGWNAGRKGCGG